MLGIDTNILFHSLNPRSELYSPANEFLHEVFKNTSTRVAITDYVLTELYMLLRNPAVMARPVSGKRAVEICKAFFDIQNVTRVENAPVMDEVWQTVSRKNSASRRIIFDVRLALTLQHHGVSAFATANVKDFKNLGFARVWNPLEKKGMN